MESQLKCIDKFIQKGLDDVKKFGHLTIYANEVKSLESAYLEIRRCLDIITCKEEHAVKTEGGNETEEN